MRLFRLCLAIVVLGTAACGRKAVTIDPSPKKVKIYGIGVNQRLSARLLDKKGQPLQQGSVAWTSSKGDVASIDSSGRLTANGEGKATITATFEKLSAQIPVEVVDIKTIEVSPLNLQLVGPAGTQFPVHAMAKSSKGAAVDVSIQWSSAKPNVVTVDPHGMLTSVGNGSSTIIAKVGDLQGACDVAVVVRDLARLELRPATAIVRAGDVQKFEVIAYGVDGKPIEGLSTVFQTSDPAVAKVDPLGLATGVASGTATIRTSLGNLTAEATLLVN
jgi:uncharacterized protein YjdB